MTEVGRVAGVVLAAGASSRMGEPKPLLPLDDSTYVQCCVDSMAAGGASPVVVVLGCEADRVSPVLTDARVAVVLNRDWEQGMLSSVQTAVRYLQPRSDIDALVLLPVDQPRIAPGTVRAVVAAWSTRGADIVAPEYQGRRGHPVLFSRRVWPELLSAPPDQGARVVVRADPDRTLEVEVDDPWICVDADTPAGHAAMASGRVDAAD